jgi:hypothetical protein
MGMMPLRIIATILLVLGFCACSTPGEDESGPAPASAGPLDEAPGGERALSIAPAEDEPSVTPTAAIAICKLSVDNPHLSTHAPGTVNVVAAITCNGAVSALALTVGLARDGLELNRSSFTNAHGPILKGNVAAPCVSGTYQGAAEGTVTFPPGSIPQTSNVQASSVQVRIDC